MIKIRDVKVKNPVYALDWSPNGEILGICTFGGGIKLYDFEQKEIISTYARGSGSISFHPFKKMFACKSYKEVEIVDYETAITQVREIRCETGASVCAVDWNSSGDLIAAGSANYISVFTANGDQVFRKNICVPYTAHDAKSVHWKYTEDIFAYATGNQCVHNVHPQMNWSISEWQL